MARIEFSGGYGIVSDANNWTAFRKKTFQSGKREGETYDFILGHYADLYSAINCLLGYKLRQSDASSLQGLKKIVENFRSEVRESLNWRIEEGD